MLRSARVIRPFQSPRVNIDIAVTACHSFVTMQEHHTSIVFPIRINRYLALQGVATRRAADVLIQQGQVFLNGKRAKLGDQVQAGDEVKLKKELRTKRPEYLYVAYYKPRGVVSHSPGAGERDIAAGNPFPGTFPLGRLDKESEGLIILTNDGRVTDRLLHPRYAHEKEYRVKVREYVSRTVIDILTRPIESEGETLTAKTVEPVGPHEIRFVLTQGKRHQLRRMCAAANLTVERLLRTRIMGVRLGRVRPGQGRVLSGEAKRAFLADLGLRD